MKHVSVCNSVKFWFRSEAFVRAVLDIFVSAKTKLKCLDVYPYSAGLPLGLIQEKLPELTAMTLRPHGQGFFWDGLLLPTFPNFQYLDTLILDSVNLEESAQLPPSITQLEWSNRREERFLDFLPKLEHLHRLEYLLLGHVDFARDDVLNQFLQVCSGLLELHFIVFRFAKFPTANGVPWVQDVDFHPLSAAKVIKLDLCYGDLKIMIKELLSLCVSSQLKILSLNCLYEDFELLKFYDIFSMLETEQISLQFGLLQKNSKKLNRDTTSGDLPFPPTCFRNILWKLDMSFLEDSEMLKVALSSGVYWQLIEMKFVNCPGLDDDFLELASKTCPRLKKIIISRCDNVTGKGVNSFLINWNSRKVRNLHIVWRSSDHPAAYYLDLLKNSEVLTDKLKSKFITKRLPGDNFCERIIVWDKEVRRDEVGCILPSKTLVIQDYSDSESHWILGFCIPEPIVADD